MHGYKYVLNVPFILEDDICVYLPIVSRYTAHLH